MAQCCCVLRVLGSEDRQPGVPAAVRERHEQPPLRVTPPSHPPTMPEPQEPAVTHTRDMCWQPAQDSAAAASAHLA